jgi:TatD DNase family protein
MNATQLVDTHCHFDLFPDPRAVLEEAERLHVYSIAVTNTPSVFKPMMRLADGFKFVRPAVGLHPELAIQRQAELRLFPELLAHTRYVGEVGLDYKAAVTPADRKKQRMIFATILRHCANAGGRVLTIHSRRAEADVVAAVREHDPGPFILHWYSGSLKVLREAVTAGAYFSVNPTMVRSESGRRLICEIPRERVLTESDGPFVRVGNAPASPSCILAVCRELASLWRTEQEQVAIEILANFRRLLGTLATPGNLP